MTGGAGGAAAAGTSGAAGATGFSAGGAAGGAAGFSTFDGGMTTAAGRATVCGVMKRGAGFSGAGGAAGFSAGDAAGLATTTFGGTGAAFGGSAGFVAAGRCGGCDAASFCSSRAFRMSPGLEAFEKSIFGFSSTFTFAALDPPFR